LRTRSATTLVLAASLASVALAACTSTSTDKPALTGSAPPAGTSAGTTVGSTSPGSTPGSTTRGSTPGSPPGSTPGTGVKAGACPPTTEITVNLKVGATVLEPKVAWAAVQGDRSLQILVANYDAPASDAKSVWQPMLTGNQVGVLLYVSAIKGPPLEPGTYQRVTTNRDTTKQFNTLLMYSAAGREIVSGFAKAPNQVTLTKIDDKVVCGTIETDEATGVFVATRV
jgi:hypothetical protein